MLTQTILMSIIMASQTQLVRNPLNLRLFIIGFSSFILIACAKEQLADPMCRIAVSYSPAPPASAACLIKLNTKLLAIRLQNESGWQLPTGSLNTKQSAQCSAHQAVWQSTGLNVEVGQLLGHSPDNTQLFACALSNGFDDPTLDIPVPNWANHKVAKIHFVDPNNTSQSQWSDNSDLSQLRTLFKNLE
jgi:ADP-ribose pyrophosphatase YjhB (NUDIX family)